MVAVLATSAGAVLVLAGCGAGGHSARAADPTTATTVPPATATTTAPTTTTHPTTTHATTTHPATTHPATTAVPSAPQTSAYAAAGILISAWGSGDRPTALTVATPAAVDRLFAVPYPGGSQAISRGCTDEFLPIVCTFGPPGGGTGAIYELNAVQAGPRWYVQSVTVEG